MRAGRSRDRRDLTGGTRRLFLGDLVVGFQNEHRDFGFYPDLGFFKKFDWNVFEGFTDCLGRIKASFLGGVVIVGAAKDTVLGGGDTFIFRNLKDPGDEIVLGEAVVGIAGEDYELFFNRGWFVAVWTLGLGGEVHLLDDLAEELGVELVLLEDLGYEVDVDFRHRERLERNNCIRSRRNVKVGGVAGLPWRQRVGVNRNMNSEEFFDVVDGNDVVVGRALRQEVHARGLWHRAVHVLVFNAVGQTFLQKRSMSKDMSPGCWDAACSGHLDSGEDYDRAATRELGEEIGVVVRAEELMRWQRVEACVRTGWEFLWVYRLRHEGPFVLHPEEIERGQWIEPAALTAWMTEKPAEFTPAFRLIWEHVAVEIAAGR